ncbi:MAG: ABC transporter permease [Candidatus Lokiarchaeota archaeon]|nr:ABC transporter permease [Candidatus Lokiarchaeota archaeon]
MTQLVEQEFELEERKEKNIVKKIFKWMGSNLKFLFVPGYRIEELTIREQEYEKTISKRKFIRRLKSVLTIIGISIVFVIVTFAVFAPWISPYTFRVADGVFSGSWNPPSPEHPLGQTNFGRDILARMIWGARSSLTIALPAITLSVVVGVIFGIIAAYFGGWVDSVIMRISDIFFAFPGLIFAIVLIGVLGRRMEYIILAYGILGIPYYSRLIRASVLQAKELPYVEAARVSGAKNWRIMFRHIMPNCIQPIIISFTFDIGGVILSFAGLAFLGYSDPHLIEWGRDIDIGRGHLVNAPWASFWPGLMIIFTVLGFMLIGDGLRDALDPRLRNL